MTTPICALLILPTELLEGIPISISGYHALVHSCKFLHRRYHKQLTLRELVIKDAIKCNSVKLYKHLNPYSRYVEASVSIDYAVRCGSLRLLKWFHKWGQTDLSNTELSYKASLGGHLYVLQWLHKNNYRLSQDVAGAAAQRGDLRIVQWVNETDHENEWQRGAAREAAYYGHLHILQWLEGMVQYQFTDDDMDQALTGGHLEVVQWLHDAGFEINDYSLVKAASVQSLPLMKWLFNNGCKLLPMIWGRVIQSCPRDGLSEIPESLLWLHRMACPYGEEIYKAALYGQLGIIKWFIEMKYPCNWDKLLEKAISFGHAPIVAWYLGQGRSVPQQYCNWAVKRGDLGVIKELHEHKLLDPRTCVYAASGHLKTLQWCRNQGYAWYPEVCSTAALIGNLEILEWARQEGCPWDKETCLRAAIHHDRVLAWVEQH